MRRYSWTHDHLLEMPYALLAQSIRVASTLQAEDSRGNWMRSGYISWWLYQSHFKAPDGEDPTFAWFIDKLMGMKEPESPEYREFKRAQIRAERKDAISKADKLLKRFGVAG